MSCCVCDCSGLYLERGEHVDLKHKHDEDADAASIHELRESLLNTCISKLAAASRLRRRRALPHTVLINNLLRSLEHSTSRPPINELHSHRACITARRLASDTYPTTTRSGSCESMTSTPDEPSALSSYEGGIATISNRHAKANNPHVAGYNQAEPTQYIIYLDANNLYAATQRETLPVCGFTFLTAYGVAAFDLMSVAPNKGTFSSAI